MQAFHPFSCYWIVLVYLISYKISVVFCNPCSSNPCIYGACHRNNDTSYLCNCNQGYFGDQCQFKPTDCLWSINNSNVSPAVYPTGSQWKNQCNGCYCLQGKITCSQLWCGLTFCRGNEDCSMPLIPCAVMPESWCLSTSCSQSGYCSTSKSQLINDCMGNNPPQKCILKTVYADVTQLSQNFTVESICQEIRTLRSLQYYTKSAVDIGCQSSTSTVFQSKYRQLSIIVSSPDTNTAILAMRDINETLSNQYRSGNLRLIILKLPPSVPSFVMPLLITGTAILVIVILISAWLIKRKYEIKSEDQVKTNNSELSNFIFRRTFSLSKPKVDTQAITANPIFVDETDATLKRKNSARSSGYFFRGVRTKKKSYEIRNSNKWKGISRTREIGSSNSLINSEVRTKKSEDVIIMRDLTKNEQNDESHDIDHHHTEEHYEGKRALSGVSGMLPHGLKWVTGKRGSSITLPQSDYPINPKQNIPNGHEVNVNGANTSEHDNVDLQIEAEASDDDTIAI